jgi:transcriptional regulator with XRE-family HTH domain
MTIRPDEIGKRLRAYRLGQGMNAEQIAERLGVSRAAVYRIEAGDVVKIDTLQRLADLLNTTVASLLGAGVEYYANALSYFERMRQLEEQCDQVVAHFPPMSHLLVTSQYSKTLRKALLESVPPQGYDEKLLLREINEIIAILDERKLSRDRRRLSVVNFVALPEIERWLKIGVVGRFDLTPGEVNKRRMIAKLEVAHLIELIESEPMGVQIGIIDHVLPNNAFQIFKISGRTILGLSPFRLGGDLPNISTGVAMVTEDTQPVHLSEDMASGLWDRAVKGSSAARLLREAVHRSAIPSASMLQAI